MNRHHIQLHHHPSTRELCRGSLLFVHGAYTDSRYWGLNFVPFFQHQGFDCFAVDLSGHGASAGGERLDEFGLDDYVEAIAHADRKDVVWGKSVYVRVDLGGRLCNKKKKK